MQVIQLAVTSIIIGRKRMMRDTLGSEANSREVLYAQIMDALDTMPERLREVFILTHYEGLSEGAIANKMGVRQPELESLVREANSTFRRAISKSQTD